MLTEDLLKGRETELELLRQLETCLRDGRETILMEKKKSDCGCSPDKLAFRNPHAYLINGYLEKLTKLRSSR